MDKASTAITESLKPNSIKALELLQQSGSLTQDTLAARLGSVSGTKRAVGDLIKNGLARYVENPWARLPSQRRVSIVRLSDGDPETGSRLGPRESLCIELLKGSADGLSMSRLKEEGVPSDSVRRCSLAITRKVETVVPRDFQPPAGSLLDCFLRTGKLKVVKSLTTLPDPRELHPDQVEKSSKKMKVMEALLVVEAREFP